LELVAEGYRLYLGGQCCCQRRMQQFHCCVCIVIFLIVLALLFTRTSAVHSSSSSGGTKDVRFQCSTGQPQQVCCILRGHKEPCATASASRCNTLNQAMT
jgi:hypothetical protein